MAATTPINYQTIAITGSGTGTSNWIVVNPNLNPFTVTLATVLSATATYAIEYAVDPINNPTDSSSVVKTAVASGSVAIDQAFSRPASAFRLNVSANTGSVTLYVRQAGLASSGNL